MSKCLGVHYVAVVHGAAQMRRNGGSCECLPKLHLEAMNVPRCDSEAELHLGKTTLHVTDLLLKKSAPVFVQSNTMLIFHVFVSQDDPPASQKQSP